jgi:hypothetical protein
VQAAIASAITARKQHLVLRYQLDDRHYIRIDKRRMEAWCRFLAGLPLFPSDYVVSIFFCMRYQASAWSWLPSLAGIRRCAATLNKQVWLRCLPILQSPDRTHAETWPETRCSPHYQHLDLNTLRDLAIAAFEGKQRLPFKPLTGKLEKAVAEAHSAYIKKNLNRGNVIP